MPRVHRDDLLIEAREAALMRRRDPRLERALPITGQLDLDRPVIGDQRVRRVRRADLAHVVLPDQRGNGRSDWSTRDRWNLDTWIDDVPAFCDALGIERQPLPPFAPLPV